MAATVFLSHAAADIELVRRVEKHAAALDIRTYAYEDDPQPGSSIAAKLQDSIRAADWLLVLLTQNSRHRPSVHAEIGIAKALGKTIIPVIEAGVDPHDFVFLQGLEWVSFDPAQAESALLDVQRQLGRLAAAKERQNLILLALLVFGVMYLMSQKKG